MRGILGRLCHGKPRGPLEPYGVVAPLTRMIAWTALLVSASSLLVFMVAFRLGTVWLIEPSIVVACTAFAVAFVARLFAAMLRPPDLTLTAWDGEASS